MSAVQFRPWAPSESFITVTGEFGVLSDVDDDVPDLIEWVGNLIELVRQRDRMGRDRLNGVAASFRLTHGDRGKATVPFRGAGFSRPSTPGGSRSEFTVIGEFAAFSTSSTTFLTAPEPSSTAPEPSLTAPERSSTAPERSLIAPERSSNLNRAFVNLNRAFANVIEWDVNDLSDLGGLAASFLLNPRFFKTYVDSRRSAPSNPTGKKAREDAKTRRRR